MYNNLKSVKNKSTIFVLLLSIILVTVLSVGLLKDKRMEQKSREEVEAFAKEREESASKPKPYSEMVLSTLGDSVTQKNTWQPHLQKEFNFKKINNLGIGGTKVSGEEQDSMWKNERINEIPRSSDIIIFTGGTNDWIQNVKLGDLNDKDINTFYGALNTLTEKLKEKYSKSKIIYMSTVFAKSTSKGAFNDKTGIVNNIGLKNIDYGMAVKKVAEKNNISFIDLTNLWGETNIKDYVNNEIGTFVHPNENGGKKMADAIIGALKKEIKTQ